MVKRVPAVTANGAFTGKVLDWLDERYGGSGAVSGSPVKVPGVTINGAFKGSTLNWLDARYGGSGAVSGSADRLPAVSPNGAFSGKVLTWLDSRYSRAADASRYALPTFTHTVDPRTYLTEGQTWTTVTDIRPAFQQALNAAHSLAFASSSNIVDFVIPPGVGKLTSSAAQGPVNYFSSTTNARLGNTIGLPLRPNMPGRIVFRGGGGRNETSTIQLSNRAKCLFYADTDQGTSNGTAAGYTWVKLDEYSSLPGNKGRRPSSLMSFQNYDFVGFCVDNNDALGQDNILSTCHTVFGAAPTDNNNRQMYMSFYNLNHSDLRVKGFDPNPAEGAEQSARAQVPFAYRTRHTSHHEATGGSGVNVWGNWNLDTLTGRQAAFNARWTFMHRMNFYDVEVVDAGRAIHVTADRTTANNVTSQWFDEVNLYRCTHTQPNPYSGTAPHTSFFLGTGGMGGTSRAVGCVSINVGDNPIEMGAFQNRLITDFTSKNARLPGILFTNTQIPPTPSTCIVDGYTFTVDAQAMLTQPRARGFEFDLEGDGVNTPISATIRNATMIIDGGSSKVAINKLIRTNRFGWVFDGPIKNLDIDGLDLIIQNVSTPSMDRGAGNGGGVALQKTYPLVWYKPSGFDLTQATCTMKNVDLTIKDWIAGPTSGTSTPAPIRIIGVLALTAGTFTLDGLKMHIDTVEGVPIADATAVGAHQTEWSRTNASGTSTRSEFFYTPVPSSRYIDATLTEPAFPALTTGQNANYDLPGGRYTIRNISGSTAGTTLPATRRLLVIQKQNPYASLSHSGISATGWGSGVITLSTDIVPNQAYTLADEKDSYGADMYYWTQRNAPVSV
ncbi:MAG: hypothetical protein WAR37_02700 [Candidatus Microsaccharimonas sp.]